MKKILIVSSNKCIKKFFKKNKNLFFIFKDKDLSYKTIRKINPEIIFFIYWHWKIKSLIYKNYLCVGFHSSPLPYGRGGSPIQNMILRGHKHTKVCAIKIQDKIDSGDIFLREKISLQGNLDDIWLRINKKIFFMIKKFIDKIPSSKKQSGKITIFRRLKPNQSSLSSEKNLKKIYDQIRMRDTKLTNIKPTFINHKNLIISFKEAKLKKNKIICKTIISLK